MRTLNLDLAVSLVNLMEQKPGESSSFEEGMAQKAIMTIKVPVDEHMRTLFKTSKAHRVTFEFTTDQFYCKCGRVLLDEKPAKRLADEGAVSVSLLLAYLEINS